MDREQCQCRFESPSSGTHGAVTTQTFHRHGGATRPVPRRGTGWGNRKTGGFSLAEQEIQVLLVLPRIR